MSIERSIDERMPPWQRLGHFDGLVVEGVDYRVQSSDVRGQLLYETSRPSITAFFDHRRWEDIRKAPGFQLRPGYHDPKHAEALRAAGIEFPSDIPPKERMWMQFQESMVLELIAAKREGKTKLVKEEVQALIDGKMGKEARRKLKERQLGCDAAGGQQYFTFDISADVLIKKRRKYLEGGFLALRDKRFKSGRCSYLQPEVASMIAIHMHESTRNPSSNPTSVLDDMRDEIEEINERMSVEALQAEDSDAVAKLELLRVPDIKTIRKAWGQRDRFSVDIGKFGLEAAIQLNPSVRGVPDKLGPMDRVEYDESIVDAIVLLTESGIWSYLTPLEKKAVRKGRLVIGVAICAVTRCIVGMRIYRVGNGEETVATFRMLFEDKTKYIPLWLRDRISWHQHGGPGQIVMDQGSSNISHEARTALANLDVPVVYAGAGKPADRGVGERIFRTFGSRIYSLLDARTGSNIIDRKNYRPEDRAKLTIDELWQALVVGVAGIYHNSPHSALGGRTPAFEWERLILDYGVNPLPDPNRRRVTFGKHRRKRATRYGVSAFGLSYVHPLIEHHYLHGHGELEVAADPEDLGAVSVRFGEQWHECLCTDPDMAGVRWSDWFRACQPQKDLASEDAQKRRAARRAAKKAIRSIQEHARVRDDVHPAVIGQDEIDKGERAVFGKYEHAEQDQPFANGQLGHEVLPDNDERSEIPVADGPAPPRAMAAGRPKKTGKWSTK